MNNCKKIIEIENIIISIVGKNTNNFNKNISTKTKSILKSLLEERRKILNKMFIKTKENLERIRLINNLLKDLNYSLFEREQTFEFHALDICYESTFGEDFEIELLFRFKWTDETSILLLNDDYYYRSNFNLVCSIIDTYFPNSSIIPPDRQKKLDHINRVKYIYKNQNSICFATMYLLKWGLYSIPDFIRLNNFISVVKLIQKKRVNQNGTTNII